MKVVLFPYLPCVVVLVADLPFAPVRVSDVTECPFAFRLAAKSLVLVLPFGFVTDLSFVYCPFCREWVPVTVSP